MAMFESPDRKVVVVVIDHETGRVDFSGAGPLEVAVIWRESRHWMLRVYGDEPEHWLEMARRLVEEVKEDEGADRAGA
jgi:hypothetical protein